MSLQLKKTENENYNENKTENKISETEKLEIEIQTEACDIHNFLKTDSSPHQMRLRISPASVSQDTTAIIVNKHRVQLFQRTNYAYALSDSGRNWKEGDKVLVFLYAFF